MPRANRYIPSNGIYPITHQCHDRECLFKFVRDGDDDQALLREALKNHQLSLLNDCITSNHVHLLIGASSKEPLSGFM